MESLTFETMFWKEDFYLNVLKTSRSVVTLDVINQAIQENSFCSTFCIRELLKKTHFWGEPSVGQ